MAVAGIVVQCTLFCLFEAGGHPFHHTLLGHQPPALKSVPLPHQQNHQVESQSCTEDKLEPLPSFPQLRQTPSSAQHVQWLRRRDSLSSQQAVFPANYQSYNNRLSLLTLGQNNQRNGVAAPPNLTFAARQGKNSWYTTSTDPSPQPSRSASFLSNSPTRPLPCRTPYTPSHRLTNARVGAIPDRFRSISTCRTATTLRDIVEAELAESVPIWCPALCEPPLSSDPAIRALSTSYEQSGEDTENIDPNTPDSSPLKGKSTIRHVTGSAKRRSPCHAPTLPRRAPGHSVNGLSGRKIISSGPSPSRPQMKSYGGIGKWNGSTYTASCYSSVSAGAEHGSEIDVKPNR